MTFTTHKVISFTILGSILMFFSSCLGFLDVSDEISQTATIEDVFSNPDQVRRWHSNSFKCIPEYSQTGNPLQTPYRGIWNTMSGEVIINSGDNSSLMTSGFNSTNAPYQRWQPAYIMIRDAYILLDNIKPLGNSFDNAYLSEREVVRIISETKFLIAHTYITLFELYGPVPIVDEAYEIEKEEYDNKRPSVDEFAVYVYGLIDEAISLGGLAESIVTAPGAVGNARYDLNQILRPTKTVALAAKAKMAVLAASPLFNGGYPEAVALRDSDGKQLFPEYNIERWKTAKKYLEDLFVNTDINHHNLYYASNKDPHSSYYELFQFYNDEILWAHGQNYYSGDMERNTLPRDLYSGWAHIAMSKNMMDLYFMNNGLGIMDAGSKYTSEGVTNVLNVVNESKRVDENISNIFANREPRFYASVIYEGKSWHIQPVGRPDYTVGFAQGEGNDNSSAASPRTGIMFNKFKNREILNTGTYLKNWARPSIIYRLADFYLYYAEVCNEIDPNDSNIITYLDMIRERAGIPGYSKLKQSGLKDIIGDQIKQRQAIQHERRVELFAEGQSYFDLRRWMICGDNEAGDQSVIYGFNMSGKRDKPAGQMDSFYTEVVTERRSWKRAMYLYPIPYNEISNCPTIIQNPGW